MFKVTNPNTFFTAQNILDSYFYEILTMDKKTEIKDDYIRLSGILAVFIASKFEDINPIKIR